MMKRLALVAVFLFIPSVLWCAETASVDPDLAKEIEIGRRAVERIEQEWPVTTDPAATSKLEMILKRLEPYMSRRIPWEVRLVNTEAMNAFCLPGGFIFFTTGILDALNTDSELAAVMAHEMIHADRKHSLRQAAESGKTTVGAIAVMILSGGSAAPVILAQMANIAITSAYTVELEAEADRLGLEAMIKAGYQPTGMITLFEKFMAQDYKQPIRDYGIYMDHPDTPKRLERAVKVLHDRHIPIQRKYPLGLLRTSIKDNGGKLQLIIDGQTVIEAVKSPENTVMMNVIRGALDASLQLELAPYDLHVESGALYIENHFIAGRSEGMTSPEDMRKNLLKVINSGRAKYPTSKFFK